MTWLKAGDFVFNTTVTRQFNTFLACATRVLDKLHTRRCFS